MAFMGLAERRGYRQKERKVGGMMAVMGLAERRGYRQKGIFAGLSSLVLPFRILAYFGSIGWEFVSLVMRLWPK
jgi:hypothetical protein